MINGGNLMKNKFMLFFKKSLMRKWFVSFILISLIPLLIFVVSAQNTARESVMSYAREQAIASMELIEYNLNKELQQYYYLTYFLSQDKQLQTVTEPEYIYQKLLNGYASSVKRVKYCGIILNNGLVLTNNQPNFTSPNLLKHDFFIKTIKSNGKTCIFNFENDENPFRENILHKNHYIYFTKSFPEKSKGMVFVAINIDSLESAMGSIADRKGSFVYILSDNQKVIFSPFANEIPSVKNKSHYLKLEHKLPMLNATLYGMINVSSAIKNVEQLITFYFIVTILLILFILGLAFVLSRSMIKPIQTLEATMEKVKEGNLSVRCEENEKSGNELQNLSQNLNLLLDHIQELLNQVYVEQLYKRKAEMAALQANIKPHFLYNTLDTLCWMAEQYQADDIVETVEALSQLFRISLSKGSEIISVKNEVLHVTSYLQIQKLRYENKLNYQIEVDENCKNLRVQKLILQPLVENALYHGLKERDDGGNIHIHIYRTEKFLMLEVKDDGVGFPPERLVEVRQALVGVKHIETGVYGMFNVQERLVLSYGKSYGLSIESTFKKGSLCTIIHPILEE